MGCFADCLPLVVDHEGGYVNHPDDPGGETKFGISKRSYPQLDIARLTLEKAAAIYERDYWLKVQADRFPAGVALLLFDGAVNQGAVTAVQLLQKALKVSPDGIAGPITRAEAIRQMPTVIDFYAAERARYYALLPTIQTFGRGWYRRLFALHGTAWGWHWHVDKIRKAGGL